MAVPDVEVIVPWRASSIERERAWEFCRGQWAGWNVHVSEHIEGPWCKARAVTPAVEASSAEIIVVGDADVFCDGVQDAVDAVAEGCAWAVPHYMLHRLDAASSEAVIAGSDPRLGSHDEEPYPGHAGGGLVVLPRSTYLQVPLDPRFLGFGNEDDSWAAALHTLAGEPWRGSDPLWHLWHPPQLRVNRRIGSFDNRRLWRRYQGAHGDPAMMRALIGEVTG